MVILFYIVLQQLGPKLSIFNISTRENINLELSGLAEKCLWDNNSLYLYCGIPFEVQKDQPDSWYQGISTFNDSFVKINSQGGSSSSIATPSENIDAINLFLDNKDETLFFTNKKDSTLWSLDLR